MKRHRALKWIVLLFFGIAASPTLAQEPPVVKPVLNNNIIINLFSQKLNEVKSNYKLGDIKFRQGEFTRAGSFDAIVGFDDENQPHATGYYEVWLLSYENGWKIKKKLFDWDVGKFEIINIGDHGRRKVWIEGGGGNQGRFKFVGKLIALSEGHEDILFLTKGYNNTGAYGDSDMFNILFKDRDGDGLVGIIETRVKGEYNQVKQESIITAEEEYVYKYNGKTYERIK